MKLLSAGIKVSRENFKEVTNGTHMFLNKPTGGLWACDYNENYEERMSSHQSGLNGVIMKILAPVNTIVVGYMN